MTNRACLSFVFYYIFSNIKTTRKYCFILNYPFLTFRKNVTLVATTRRFASKSDSEYFCYKKRKIPMGKEHPFIAHLYTNNPNKSANFLNSKLRLFIVEFESMLQCR